MENILSFEKRVEDYLLKNKDEKNIKSKEEIQKILGKWFSTSQIKIHRNEWVKHISESEVQIGIDCGMFCVVLSKTHFVLASQTGITGMEYRHLPLINFSKISLTKKELLYDEVRMSNLSEIDRKNSSIHINLFQTINDEIISPYLNDIEQEELRLENERKKQERIKEEQRLKNLNESQTNVLNELDKDGNGEIDVIEGNDFNLLLKKHQKGIVEIDRTYVQQFVKVSSYLKTKKGNIQSIFNSIKDTPNQEVLNEYVEILKDEIHTYNLILFNSLNMIVSLVEDDMITFYEIHEMFDTLNMFDSKHEKDVSQKLTNIGYGLKDLMYEIRDMGNQISDSIGELSYVTEQSNQQLTNQLSEIDSTMKVGNLINTINTYQNYKNNKNTKSLRG